MAIDSAAIWGKNVADAIAAIGVTAGSDVTPTQLEAVWTAVKGEDKTQLGKAAVAPGTFFTTDVVTGVELVTGIGGPIT